MTDDQVNENRGEMLEQSIDAYQEEPEGRKRRPVSVSRRTFTIGVASAAVLFGLGALRYVGHTPLTRPPGGQDEAHLVSACIRCERCYEVCPRNVIVPAHIEDGLLGMRTPTFDFSSDYCSYCKDENDGEPLCVASCPTGALQLPEDATADTVIIGKAELDKTTCLAFRDTGCRECYDACKEARGEEHLAIELTGNGDNIKPKVIADKCNGCGACEAACISLSAGSIVTGATERAIVIRPVEE